MAVMTTARISLFELRITSRKRKSQGFVNTLNKIADLRLPIADWKKRQRVPLPYLQISVS